MVKKERQKIGKKAQITLFIIIAIILVAAIALIFIITKPTIFAGSPARDDPESYIRTCASTSAILAETELIKHGGFMNPQGNLAVTVNGSNLIWMCYTANARELCMNKHPMLRAEIEKEIERTIKPEIEKCFNEVKAQLGRYDYKDDIDMKLKINLLPRQVEIQINKSVSYTKDEKRIELNNFNTRFNSPLFNFVTTSLEIVNQEIKCNCEEESCNADIIKMTMNDPSFQITKPIFTTTGTEVYNILETSSGKEFAFALRNCVKEI